MKISLILSSSAFIMASIFMLQSCSKDQVEIIAPVDPPVPTRCDSLAVTYTKDIEQIITDNCIMCHSSQAPILGSYTAAKNHADAIHRETVTERTMPVGFTLTDAQIELINCWKEAGYPE